MLRGLFAVALCAGACTARGDRVPPSEPLQVLQGKAFGTTWTVKWRGDRPTAAAAEPTIEAVLSTVDLAMSSWRDDSELARIRTTEGPVPVSEETAEVVGIALALAEATDGAFDPTVEPLMALWGFRGEPRSTPPSDAEIAAALAQVGWTRVVIGRDARGRATVDGGGSALDLSAIAKGHAVDRVANELAAEGASELMVEIGGEVRTFGAWRIGVDRPDAGSPPGSSLSAIVELRNAGMATSGNYRSAYDAAGTSVVHTMDPRVGRPRGSRVASASVIAPDCRTADAWATALMVLEPGAGRAMVEARPGIDALWILTGDDGFTQVESSGMSRWLTPGPAR